MCAPVATTSRARTTLSTSPASMRSIASAITPGQRDAGTAPSARRMPSAGSAPTLTCSVAGSHSAGVSIASMLVTQARPSRCPATTRGTTRPPPSAESEEKANEPKATNPVPGRPTSSTTSAPDTTSCHHREATSKRSGPADILAAARPHPISPLASRTQLTTVPRSTSWGSRSNRSGTTGASRVRARRRGRRGTVTARQPMRCGDGKMTRMSRASLDKAPREVAEMFDEVAGRYDLTNDVLSLGQDRLWRRAVVRAVDARPGERILDIAAGTGTSSEPFADAGVDVVPADFSLGMLRAGNRRRPDLPFTAADALALPFADNSFDVVTMSFGLRNVADTGRALEEFHRVTTPGGRLLICEFSTPAFTPFRTVYQEYLMRALPSVA